MFAELLHRLANPHSHCLSVSLAHPFRLERLEAFRRVSLFLPTHVCVFCVFLPPRGYILRTFRSSLSREIFCHFPNVFRRLCPLTRVCVSQPPCGYIFWTFRSSLFRHIPFLHICTLSNIHFCSCCHCHFSRHATQKRFATGRVTSAATKIALLRTTATPQETAATLAYPTNRSAASRARETPQETEARVSEQRNGAAASRASETPH